VHVHLNGRLVAAAEACVPVLDRGFLYGDGIFESMRAAAGIVFRFERHWARLRGSAALVGLELPVGAAGLRQEVRDLLETDRLREARVRVTVTRGPGRPGDLAAATGPATRVITAAPFVPLDPGLYAEGVGIAVVDRRQMPREVLDPAIKSTSRLHLVLARREAAARSAFEALLLDASGCLTEGTASNVFLVRGGRLLTPPAPGAGLPGVTREAVLEVAGAAGVACSEEPLPAAALYEADEVFLTNTSWEVLPVRAVDARPVGGGRPGPVTDLLLRGYRDLVRRECG
jgi:branched-chain amino acid aminotransferase